MDDTYEDDFDWSDSSALALARDTPAPLPVPGASQLDLQAAAAASKQSHRPAANDQAALAQDALQHADEDFTLHHSAHGNSLEQSPGASVEDAEEAKQSTLKASAGQSLLQPQQQQSSLESWQGAHSDTIKGPIHNLSAASHPVQHVRRMSADELDIALDVDLPDRLDSGSLIRPRASFDSQISLESTDEPPSPRPRHHHSSSKASQRQQQPQRRKPRESNTSLSSQAEDANEAVEDGFDLPEDLNHFSLSSHPSQHHSRLASTSSSLASSFTGTQQHNSAPPPPQQTPSQTHTRSRSRASSATSGTSVSTSGARSSASMLLRPGDSHSRSTKHKSSMTSLQSPSSAEEGDGAGAGAAGGQDSDAHFFADLEMPDFFGAAAGGTSADEKHTTPATSVQSSPSKPLASTSSPVKSGFVDLQAILKAKMAARSTDAYDDLPSPSSGPLQKQQQQQRSGHQHQGPQQSRRRRHREQQSEALEDGLVLDDASFSRNPNRGSSLDSWVLAKKFNLAPSGKDEDRPSSASAVMHPGSAATATLGRRGLVHSKSFVKALSDATATAQPQTPASAKSESSSSSGPRSPAAGIASGGRPTLSKKRSTPLLQQFSPAAAHPTSTHASDVTRSRTISLNRKSSMPLPSMEQQQQPQQHYATPTQTSVQRYRRTASQNSNDERASASSPVIPPTRPSTPAGAGAAVRLTLPTASSMAKQRSRSSSSFLKKEKERSPSTSSACDPTGSASSTLLPSYPQSRSSSGGSVNILRKPKKSSQYGDGTELDAFDDLPASKERERRFQKQPRGRASDSNGGPINKNDKKPPHLGQRRVHPSAAPRASPSGNNNNRSHGKKKGDKAKPHLIRNLGSSTKTRVEGDMVWNPRSMRWEGNDNALRAFDNVLTSSARPALISPLIMHSPSSASSASKPRSSGGLTAGLGGVRVVGEMMFDPARMSWFPIDKEGEEEEEVDWGDDEADGPPSSINSASQEASSLEQRASFGGAHERSSLAGSVPTGDDFFRGCYDVEKRHKAEMKNVPVSAQDMDDRSYLWKIRHIVMKGSL